MPKGVWLAALLARKVVAFGAIPHSSRGGNFRFPIRSLQDSGVIDDNVIIFVRVAGGFMIDLRRVFFC